MEDFGIILDTLGVLMVAFMALRVHHRMLKEHKVDKYVEVSLNREQIIGIVGVILIVIGTVLQLAY